MILAKGNLHYKVPPVIKIEGQSIRRVDSFKYLGIHFGTGLAVGAHVNAITAKTKSLFTSLGRITQRDWATKAWSSSTRDYIAL